MNGSAMNSLGFERWILTLVTFIPRRADCCCSSFPAATATSACSPW